MTVMDPQSETEPRPPTGMPRWVKISLIAVAVLIAAFLILKATGVGGEHGPGRHAPSGETGHRPPPGVPNHGG